jgi:uncharacterized membrane protein YccF (DUF307 family)
MRILANILWHVPFLGFLSALGTFLVGTLLVITLVGAPIGLGLIQLSKFLLTPFTSEMINKSDITPGQNILWQTFGFMVRIIYFPIGLILALATIFQIAGLFMSIFGIPVAIVLSKSLGTYFNPVNKICVSTAVADELKSRKARAEINKRFGI